MEVRTVIATRRPLRPDDGQRQALSNLASNANDMRKLIPALRNNDRLREADRAARLLARLDDSIARIRETRLRQLEEDFQDLTLIGWLVARRVS
jgi:hypothetical protein